MDAISLRLIPASRGVAPYPGTGRRPPSVIRGSWLQTAPFAVLQRYAALSTIGAAARKRGSVKPSGISA